MIIGMVAAMPFPALKAAAIRVHNMARMLIKDGQTVYLFCNPGTNQETLTGLHIISSRPVELGKKYYSWPGKLWRDLELAGKLARSIRKQRLTLIYAHSREGLLIALVAKSISLNFRLPVINDVHGPFIPELIYYRMLPDLQWLNKIMRLVERLISLGAARLIATSEGLKKYLTDLGIPENKITVYSDYFIKEDFSRILAAQTAISRPGLAADKIVMYVGMLKDYQGIAVLLKAFQAVVTSGCKAELLIIGNTNLAKYQILAKELNLGDAVQFLGLKPRQEIPAYLKMADVCVSARVCTPVTAGGFVSQLPEYLAAGQAVVATDISDCRLVVGAGAGIIVPPGNAEELAKALQLILNDDPVRRKMQQMAVVQAEKYSWEYHYPRFKEMLESVGGGAR